MALKLGSPWGSQVIEDVMVGLV